MSKPQLIKYFSQSHILFLIVSVPAIFIFIMLVPLGFGPDEEVHTARAYQISTGNLYPDSLGAVGRFGGNIPTSLIKLFMYGSVESNSMNKAIQFYSRKDIRTPATYNELKAANLNSQQSTIWAFGSTGPYTPVVYMPAAVGMYIGRHFDLSVGMTVGLAKSLQAIMYIALCYTALWIVRDKRARWLLFIIALLPMSIFQASILTADTFTTAAVILFAAIVFKLFTQLYRITNKQIVAVALATSLLMLTKPSYAIFCLALLALPASLFRTKNQHVLLKLAVLFLSAAIFVAVSWEGLQYASSISLMSATPTNSGGLLQVQWILSHPVGFMKTIFRTLIIYPEGWSQDIVGRLGYNLISTPYILVITTISMLVAAGLYVKDYTKRVAALFFVLGALSVFSVIFLLFATFNTTGASLVAGIQGRYFIPCIPFVLIGLARFIPVSINVTNHKAALLFGSVAAITLYSTVYIYITALY